jgi:hypothetical protein
VLPATIFDNASAQVGGDGTAVLVDRMRHSGPPERGSSSICGTAAVLARLVKAKPYVRPAAGLENGSAPKEAVIIPEESGRALTKEVCRQHRGITIHPGADRTTPRSKRQARGGVTGRPYWRHSGLNRRQ